MAYFGAVGTYISDSGIEYLLTEAGVLAPGSLAGLIKGKFYNRCRRVHQIIATVMERMLFLKFKDTLLSDDHVSPLTEMASISSDDDETFQRLSEMAVFRDIMEKYDDFLRNMIEQEYGSTAKLGHLRVPHQQGVSKLATNRSHKLYQRIY